MELVFLIRAELPKCYSDKNLKTQLMKTITILTAFISIAALSNAQTPALVAGVSSYNSDKISSLGDTITFLPYASGTIMNTQYANEGVTFSGFNGSGDPDIYDYGTASYGRVLKSDSWYNPLRINFVDTANTQYHLAQKIEFDNPVAITETDYISVDAYDSMDVLLYHYLSTSPEHVVLNFPSPSVAYITLDDSANTAYIVDNILVDFGTATSVNELSTVNAMIYPNPFTDKLEFTIENAEPMEVTLFDITARKLLQQSFTKALTLNTTSLSKGIYFYEVRNKNGVMKKGKAVKN
jgi:hypothetical protein